MATLQGLPYFALQFDKDAELVTGEAADALRVAVEKRQFTDLFVISHGWNNDMEEAKDLYKRFFAALAQGAAGLGWPQIAGPSRKFAVLGVFWPSKKFAEEENIPGGAASVSGTGRKKAAKARLEKRLKELQGFFGDDGKLKTKKADQTLEKARALLPKLETDPKARARFADLLRDLLTEKKAGDEETPKGFFSLEGNVILDKLKSAPTSGAGLPEEGRESGRGGSPLDPEGGALIRRPGARPAGTAGVVRGASAAKGPSDAKGPDPEGGAAFLGLDKVWDGAKNLLNLVTYYQMKERAFLIGSQGLNPLLHGLKKADPALRLHLIGHSFGGRLVTSALLGGKGAKALVAETLTLLQAAFSHFGFAAGYKPGKNGFFRKVVAENRVKGPILISHTRNDRAVGWAYPVASRLAGQEAAALGDRDDLFGGLGSNGALPGKTPEAVDGALQKVGGGYAFAPGKIFNLKADAFISGHGDIARPEVGHALAVSIRSV